MMTNAKPHILVVDDEPATANYFVRMLESEYKVQCAPDATHVLNVALRKGKTPDLILLDVSLPRREGFEICRLLKADERTRDVPVMLITQRDNVEDEVRGLRLAFAMSPSVLVVPLAVQSRGCDTRRC